MTATNWSAGSTASRSAAPSSARACSTARATPPRSRWCIWWRGCKAGGYRLLDTQFVTDHLQDLRRRRGAASGAITGCWRRRSSAKRDFARAAARPRRSRGDEALAISCAASVSARQEARRLLRARRRRRLRRLPAARGAARGFAAGCVVGGRFRHRRILAAFAVGQPHVVDRMLDRVQAGARREHPAGEDALDLALQRHLVDLDEGVGVRRLGRRPRVADARRHLQRAELHRLVDRDVERDDAAGDLVEAGEHRGRIGDALRRRLDHDLVAGAAARHRPAAAARRGWRWPGGRPGSAARRPAACSRRRIGRRGSACGAGAARRAAAAAAATGCRRRPARL